ncbi:uncharacterized protein GIQ15_03693 [Arthroderma uncinatum]|uniref:uncharacterized protein n=1 Tax=Arthroderma uncinatum TaxID=74035 RepID=UPI00144AAD4E|nr:uncharacterized protein GIQ15_03693 [Arthroderma uncinatum]KAF3484369.1 hypothetical protein GIQ15_03693 [Arthroderma uncinatum]
MNNEQFRRLLIDNAATSSAKQAGPTSKRSSGENAAPTGRSGALGSRMRSSIPMTPRAVSGVDFARQLAEHRRESQGRPPTKKFKSSTGPKGYKYTSGYEDRASLRQSNDDKAGDDREERVRALEELLKLGQIDQRTFNKLRAEIGVGGDVSTSSSPPEPTLGNKFKKIGSKESDKKRWIETDANGRRKEILVITDSEGKTKRKTRWLDKPGETNGHLLAMDKDAKPLGMEVPPDVLARMKTTKNPEIEDDDDDDIFAGVGDDYNPLANADENEDTSSEAESDMGNTPTEKETTSGTDAEMKGGKQPSPLQRRDYFSTGKVSQQEVFEPQPEDRSNPFVSDPTIMEALKRAAAIKPKEPLSDDDTNGVDREAALKHKSFLEEARRREREDALDMDMGFGESRFGDDDDEEFFEQGGASNKRKRGPKKRKGDKDNVGDVMSVLKGRRKTGDTEKRTKG